MKKLFAFLLAVISSFSINAQTTKTMMWGGVEREYLEYVPSSYQAGTPAPVLFVFHGLGDDMSNMFNGTGFKAIANAHGWIVITPQALPATIASMSIGTAWNSGVSATLYSNTFIINEDVDDAGFVMAILDDLIQNYNVDQSNVFCTGFSMGGFMSNRMAIEYGNRIKAIASVSGTIGNELISAQNTGHVSAMHIHGTADQMVKYANAEFTVYNNLSVSIGLGAEATVDYWRNYNQCSATPTHTTYPDNVDDGMTFEKFLYENGENGTKTAFIKVTGGDHYWYYTPANDIDYATEIYNFFASCMEPVGINEPAVSSVNVYPNPTKDFVHISGKNISNIQIYNTLGQLMMTTTSTDISVGDWSDGVYTINVVLTDGRLFTRKMIKK